MSDSDQYIQLFPDSIMKEKKMFSKTHLGRLAIVAIVTAAIVFAAGCAAPTAAPATSPEVAAPATSAPAATSGAAPAADNKWCSNTKIVFFPGGTPGGGFETVVYNGALAAAADTGANVQYVWSDWDPSKMVTQFTQAMATKPDGIAIMGHPGDQAFDPLIDEAEKQGIIVTSMNTQLPDAQGKYSSKGFGYAGAILYNAGYPWARKR